MVLTNSQDSLTQARAKLTQIFRYVQAFNNLQNPVQKEVQDQSWVLWFHDLPQYPTIRVGLRRASEAEEETGQNGKTEKDEEDYILKVGRPKLTEPPEPPRDIVPFLKQEWQNADTAVVEPTKEGVIRNNARLKRLFDEWMVKLTAWVGTERPVRRAMSVYEQLSELRGRIERESEAVEVVLGDGILSWNPANAQGVHHPLVLLRLQLHFNPQIPEFTLAEADQPPELYTTLFQSLPVNDTTAVARIRQDFEQSLWSPRGGNETSQFLERLVHHLSPRGSYSAQPVPPRDRTQPQVMRDPVLFLRNRSQGFNTAIENILLSLPEMTTLPFALTSLVGIEKIQQSTDIASQTTNMLDNEDESVLLSKPANGEQIEIARRLAKEGAVLVQGPPGTGKTHTIANLLGHLLAQGKSVLVTSHTPKALRVLREKVVEPLQPLCVSILEDDSRKQMESSIDGITERLSFANVDALEHASSRLTRERTELIARLRRTRQQLKDARNSEYEAIVLAGQQFSPSDAARFVASHREALSWIPVPVVAGKPLPLSPVELIDLYRTNATVSPTDEREMVAGLPDPTHLPSPATLEQYIIETTRYTQQERDYRRDLWKDTPAHVAPSLEHFQLLQERLTQALGPLQDQTRWRLAAIAAGREGGPRRQTWEDLIQKIESVSMQAAQAESMLFEYDPVLPNECLPGRVEQVLEDMLAHVEQGGKFGGFTLLMHKDWKILLEQAKVKGQKPETKEHFAALLVSVRLKTARADLLGRWQRQMTSQGGPTPAQLGSEPERICQQYVYQLRQCVSWYTSIWQPLEQELVQQGLLWHNLLAEMPVQLTEHGDLQRLCNAVRLKLPDVLASEIKRRHQRVYESKLKEAHDQLYAASSGAVKAEFVQRLRATFDRRDCNGYKAAFERLVVLRERQKDLEIRYALLQKLEQSAPGWASAIRHRDVIHGMPDVPSKPDEAWLWRQLQDELERRAATSLETLQESVAQLTKQLHATTAQLVENKAWAAQVRRTTLEQRQALQGWKEIMRKIGKGTGKRVPQLRADARKQMRVCQTAIPVWIMPLSLVVQNFDPRRTRFDVVIIDEASQADIKALAAIYMGEQVLVVGDDEQVTPLAVGQRLDEIDRLINEHLQGITNKSIYDGKLSVYSLAKTSFPPICLREHFRCVSPIIQFSNNLSYQGKIIPLRDDSEVQRRPPTIAHRVKSTGVRGDVNEEEAQEIASLLVAATQQPEYKDATFGVISMVKEQQALRIDTLLRKYLSATEYMQRRILCGTSAQFQGDERDVIFMSMVDAPNENGGPLSMHSEDGNDYMYKKRFNVAASRARDQMWVVHSLNPDIDLKEGDIRKKLILHALNPDAYAIKLAEQERKADSEFEKRVMRRLMQAGYRVIAQWPVGAYRIDLVVEGNGKRLAVECDGDRWHSIENLEEDMARQAVLERLGWRFVRIRGSQFFRNEDEAMQPVFARLRELNIPAEGMKNMAIDANQISAQNEALKSKIIRRASELRKQWAA